MRDRKETRDGNETNETLWGDRRIYGDRRATYREFKGRDKRVAERRYNDEDDEFFI